MRSSCGISSVEQGKGVLPDALRLSIVSGRLAIAVARSGLTRSEIAERSGVSSSALSRYIRGERLVSTSALIGLCETLNVSADWLLGCDSKTREHLSSFLGR